MSPRFESGGGQGAEYHLDEDRCLDLLNGLMSPEEKLKALAHMEGCVACESLVRARVSDWERSRSEIEEVTRRLRPEPNLSDMRTRDVGAPAGFGAGIRAILRRRAVRVSVGVAAAALAVITAVMLFRGPAEGPQLDLLPDISADLRFRAEEAPPSGEFVAGMAAYSKHDFVKAIALLEKAQVPPAHTNFKVLYLGSALAWDGRYDDAIAVLRPLVAETLPEPWGAGVLWTYFVSLHRSGDHARADSLADVLAQEPDALGERARRYLRRDVQSEPSR